jgi:hypothetical protein
MFAPMSAHCDRKPEALLWLAGTDHLETSLLPPPKIPALPSAFIPDIIALSKWWN